VGEDEVGADDEVDAGGADVVVVVELPQLAASNPPIIIKASATNNIFSLMDNLLLLLG
jgi:hypothetical protein